LIVRLLKDMPKHRVPLNKEVLHTRISYIEDSLRSLERFIRMNISPNIKKVGSVFCLNSWIE
jgi:hypothetical protein